MASDRRVVLVKPGDMLVIGNVGPVDVESISPALETIKDTLRLLKVIVFEGDIDLAAVPRG